MYDHKGCSWCMTVLCDLGERFEQLLLRLTAYVLRIVCLREAKAEGMLVNMFCGGLWIRVYTWMFVSAPPPPSFHYRQAGVSIFIHHFS